MSAGAGAFLLRCSRSLYFVGFDRLLRQIALLRNDTSTRAKLKATYGSSRYSIFVAAEHDAAHGGFERLVREHAHVATTEAPGCGAQLFDQPR
jgi:hypothetical protein